MALLPPQIVPAQKPNSERSSWSSVFSSCNSSHKVTMGIKGLTKLLKTHAPNSIREEKLESYRGKRIAIDVSISIYQFLVVIGRNGCGTLTNQSGKVTSHLQGMFYRTTRLLKAGMMPVYVFDGEPPDMKKNVLMRRFSRHEKAEENLMQAIKIGEQTDIVKYSKQTVKVTKQNNEDCKTLLTLMGVPVVQAPCEAEAECAFLCKVGKVDAVASEDTDSLAFGSPRLLRFLMVGSTKNPIMDFEMSKVLEELNLSMDQFVDMCILCGCDYCDGIGGIGPQTSLKLIRKHGSIEEIVGNIDKERFQIPVDWPYLQARCLFKAPQISQPQNQLKLEWSTPDEEGLKRFLVDENGFNYERVMKVIEKIKSIKDESSQEMP